MPVVRISGLPQAPGVDPGSVLGRLCLRLAEVDGVDARHWWATWQPISPDAYVEGDVPAPNVQPRASHPPIVEILAFAGRDPALVERLLMVTSEILADGLGMAPGNVFAVWTELQPGRVSTGGVVRHG
ncbi:MAG: tautomerase family protein [Chloroflexota bacterium]|nr:tautomerase family protein [Chloroflexota bacterium]